MCQAEGQSRTCVDCGRDFLVDQNELVFLERASLSSENVDFPIPAPQSCPGCRERQRLSYRNEWNLYRRRCDATGRSIIAIYPKESPFPVYDQDVWWSDVFDPLSYGCEFDFSRAFFEQFAELNYRVPKLAIQNAQSENSAYTNYSWENKNCYMAVGTGNSEDCYYCYRVTRSRDVCDCYDLHRCELCYECSQSTNLYGCLYSRNCHNSSGLELCENLRSCSECFGCTNLRNAEFCVFNERLGEGAYRERVKELRRDPGRARDIFEKLKEESFMPSAYAIQCEESSGDQLLCCSRCKQCFTLKESQDCRYFGTGENNRDCVDCNFCDNSELEYFSTNLEKNYRVLFSALVWYTDNSAYLQNCFHSSHLFGCSGMKHNKYCILNKQYTQSEYFRLLSQIVSHMRETGEWGRFFPISQSPFPYNRSVAGEYYPLSRESVLKEGFRWEDDNESEKEVERRVSAASVGSEIRCCVITGKAYRLVGKELEFYSRLGVPLPEKCPEIRHAQRMAPIRRALAFLG